MISNKNIPIQTLSFSFICLIFFSCNTLRVSSTEAKNLFIVPQKTKSLVCKIENNKIKVLSSFDASFKSKSIVLNKNYIVSVDKSLSVFYIGGRLKRKSEEMYFKSINHRDDTIYLGGSNHGSKGEIFAIAHISGTTLKIKTIKIPIDISEGKSIDDILILDNKITLVDNEIFPKYLIEYDISEPNNLKHLKTEKLPNNGTYEHIEKGTLNKEWMALLSSTFGSYGCSNHINVLGKTTGSISKERKCNFEFEDKSNPSFIHDTFKDIVLIENFLYIAFNGNLVALNLNGPIEEGSFKQVPTKTKNILRIIKTPDNRIVVANETEFELIDEKK